MSDYQQPIFYDSSYLSLEEKEELCREAYSMCYHWHVDNQPGWTRERIDMPFEEVLRYLYSNKCHFVIIHRRGYFEKCLEIGFSTLDRGSNVGGDIFLWLNLDEDKIPYFVNKYNLNKIL